MISVCIASGDEIMEYQQGKIMGLCRFSELCSVRRRENEDYEGKEDPDKNESGKEKPVYDADGAWKYL